MNLDKLVRWIPEAREILRVASGLTFLKRGTMKFLAFPAGERAGTGWDFADCGSAIVSSNSAMSGMAFVRVSSLDDLVAVEPQMTVYASRAPAWAPIDRNKPVFDEMPEGGSQVATASP